MTNKPIFGLTLAFVASLLACATPNKYNPTDSSSEDPDGQAEPLPDGAVAPDRVVSSDVGAGGDASIDQPSAQADAPVESDGPRPDGLATLPIDGNAPPPDLKSLPPDTGTPPPPTDACGSASDVHNCGSCGHDCTQLPNVKPGATVTCQAGHCSIPAASCTTGHGHCGSSPADNGCETDISLPATCGCTACGSGQVCNASGSSYQCACGGAKPDKCGNTCVTLGEDSLNCGSCGHSCLGGPCASGKCQPLQLYSGDDATSAYAVDSQFVYVIRQKGNTGTLRVISRMSKVDGSGFKDIWATDIGPYNAGLFVVNGVIYWSGENDIMGCPAPDCSGGPQVKVANQRTVYDSNIFSNDANGQLYWVADDATVTKQRNLMRLGGPTPLATTMDDFRYGTADDSFVYVQEADNLVRIALQNGTRTAFGAGQFPKANSSKVVFTTSPILPSGGSSLSVWSVLKSPLGSARMLVGDYGTSYVVWGGLVTDEQKAYWMIYAEDKNGGPDGAFIFECSLSGCGNNPTVLAKGNYPLGILKTDGQSLYMSGGGVYKLAK
jgi:hypothetical protein